MAVGSANRASKGDETRERIKLAARKLFAKYGIEQVTIRDIAKAAGQKNGGSVNYYFRSKEDLIVELLDDAASAREQLQSQMLDRLEGSRKPLTVRSILRVIAVLDADDREEAVRFFAMLNIYRRDLMHTAIPGRWDRTYQRCVDHLRGLLPSYPEAVLRQRLYFLIPYLWNFLATRDGGSGQAQFWTEFWADPSTIETLLDTAEGILVQPMSAETLSARRRPKLVKP